MSTVIPQGDTSSAITGYLTRLALRRVIGLMTGGDSWIVDTAKSIPSPSVDEIAFDSLRDSSIEGSLYEGLWLYRVGTGEERRIASADIDTGQVRPTRSFSTTPVAGDEFEIHRFQPSAIHQAIADGLRRCKRAQMVPLVLTSSQHTYNLSTYLDIQKPSDVLGIYMQPGTDQPFVQLPWAHVEFVNGAWQLFIDPAQQTATGYTLYMKVLAGYAAPATDSAYTDCPLDWARYGVLVSLLDNYILALGPGHERARMDAERLDAMRRFRHYSKLYQPPTDRRIQFATSQQWSLW